MVQRKEIKIDARKRGFPAHSNIWKTSNTHYLNYVYSHMVLPIFWIEAVHEQADEESKYPQRYNKIIEKSLTINSFLNSSMGGQCVPTHL